MSSSPSDMLQRRILPGLVVSLSRITWPARLGAAARRRLGRRGRLELFFAFDDPCGAIALIDLAERLEGRDVMLLLRPVVKRGIPGDPAVEQKRRYAVEDARRLARRLGLTLGRNEPLRAEQTAFLAEWVACTPQGPALEGFCLEAMRRLWLTDQGPIERDGYERLWLDRLGSPPPGAGGPQAVERNERLMKRRRPYDVPAAWVHGQWFFAHDRLGQIEERLDELGWRRA